MSARTDTTFLKRRRGRQKREIDDSIIQLQTEIEGYPMGMDIDIPDSPLMDHIPSNSEKLQQVATGCSSASRVPPTLDEKNPWPHVAGGCARGLASFAMFTTLPRIMAYLSKGDLVRLALVNKDLYHEAMRLLYRHLWWDIHDANCNSMLIRLIRKNQTSTSSLFKPLILYVRSLFVQVKSPSGSYDHETGFRLALLLSVLPHMRCLRKFSIADCREVREIKKYGSIPRMESFVEEIIWGEGTTHLETLEVLMDRDLTFFISLLSQTGGSQLSSAIIWGPPSHLYPMRKPSIKHFTLRCAYLKEGNSPETAAFEYQLAYLLLILSPVLTHLTLVGLPKPQYLACPQDVGTGEWGGSVGKVFEILGPRTLRMLEELTIEAADTRYEVAEGALSSWISEHSVYAKPPTDEELRQKRLKIEERELQASEPENATFPAVITEEFHWYLFGQFHHEDYEDGGEPHLNCDSTCHIHGSTSGTFTLSKDGPDHILHVNPLLRRQQLKRTFRHLHLLNCPEPWPAFYTIACVHPPTTMHFSSPWMDASSSDIPDSLRELGIEKSKLAVTPESRKVYGESPVFPIFNQGSFINGVDHSDRDPALPRPTSTHRLHCRRIRKKMEQYMSMLGQVPAESCSIFSPSLAQVMSSNMKRIELRTLERVSMKFLQSIVNWYGESLEVIGISRLDGTHKEASAKGHVRIWGKILGRCSKLKELRIVWNLFDDVNWEDGKSGTKMKFGIGERSLGGKEVLIAFSEDEWWETSEGTTQDKEEVEIDDSSSDVDNGEGPSTQRPILEAASETQSATISADKSSESREGATSTRDMYAKPATGSSPVKWLEGWYRWSEIKRYFPPETSCFSYITPDGARYLKKSEGPAKNHGPGYWTDEQMKELLMFLIDWKYRKLEMLLAKVSSSSMGTADARPPAKRSLSPQEIDFTREWRPIASTERKIAMYSRHQSQVRGNPFRVAYEGKAIPDEIFHDHFNFSMNGHNAKIFQERLKEEYLAREKLLASTIWDIIDSDIGDGKRAVQQKWRDRFFVTSPSDHPKIGGLNPPQGVIFTNRYYNEFEGDQNTETYYPGKRLGEWENALNELLSQTPPVFNVPAGDKFRVLHHQCIIGQVSSFFQEINLWHRKVRLESTLGRGLRRFCALAWVMFEEVGTLEKVVGLLENGREVIAHPVRSYQGSKSVVEVVKIRCWSCGGGWAGDYRNGTKGSGPVRLRIGARESSIDYCCIVS